LGHVVSNGGIAVDHSKVQDVLNWKPPINISEIHSFLDWLGTIEGLLKDSLSLLSYDSSVSSSGSCSEDRRHSTTTQTSVRRRVGKNIEIPMDGRLV
jgi:hypothetical protein